MFSNFCHVLKGNIFHGSGLDVANVTSHLTYLGKFLVAFIVA